ncbi:MAG: BamA/TamA family outer membrane protein [Pseudomonadota bacterium]|nr:BamA/TamA family outer membrane protein [Pseudomonadota bacterium]
MSLIPFLLCLVFSYSAANTSIEVESTYGVLITFAENIPDNIQQNSAIALKNYLEKYHHRLSHKERTALVAQIPNLIHDAAKPFGYFHSQCDATSQDKDNKVIEVSCHLGPPVIIQNIEITCDGTGQNVLTTVIKESALSSQRGDIFDANIYDKSKQELLSIAYEHGFINANTTSSKVVINTDKNTANINFVLDSKKAFVFDKIRFEQNDFSERFLRDMADFKTGDLYQAQKLHEYQNTLQLSGLFNTVSVRPSVQNKNNSNQVPIYVQYEPIDKTQFRLGIGYNSDTKLNGFLGQTHNRIGKRGEKINTELYASREKTILQGNIYIPRSHPKFDYYTIESQFSTETIINDNKDDSFYFTFNHILLEKLGEKHFSDRKLSLIYALDWSQAKGESKIKSQLIYPKLEYQYYFSSHDQSFNALLGGEIQGNSDFFLSELSFIKLVLYSNLRSSEFYNFRVLFKSKYGIIETPDTLPLSWYFRTGGTYSVRGFEYESIGDPELSNNTMLFTYTNEIQRKIYESIYLSAFYDAGNASDNIFKSPTSQSIGTGSVWESPFGNIEFSIAWPVKNYSLDKDNYKFHVALKKGFY